MPVECEFAVGQRKMRAVRGRTVGDHTTIYHVLAQLAEGERVTGTLRAPAAQPSPAPEFQAHPWVSDDIGELIPTIIVRKDGVDHRSDVIAELKPLDSSPAHQRWYVRKLIPALGMVFEWWADIHHLDPVMECWGRLTWSQRSNPAMNLQVDAVLLEAGELFMDYFAKAKGFSQPVAVDRNWHVLVSGPRGFTDGSGIHFAGQMLAFISNPTSLPVDLDLETDTGWISWSIRSLMAAGTGWPVVGSARDWNGHLLAAKNEPRFHTDAEVRNEMNSIWSRFMNKVQNGGDYYDEDYPFGIGRSPGQTGDQEDFGAVKGTFVVTLHEPKMLLPMMISAYSDCYRIGGALFEDDGKPLNPLDHPQWITWSGYTHYHSGVSRDRLGKADGWFTPAPGYWNYDDQHRSQNGLCATLALLDDPLADAIIRGYSITDAAMIRNRVGATRAVGRLFGAWSQFVLLSDGIDLQRWLDRIGEKLATVLRDSAINAPGPVKVITWGGPDNRKQVYYPVGHPQAGQLGAWWSAWEHGLFAVGCYNMWKATNDQRAFTLLERVCRTALLFGTFFENGKWWMVADSLYLDGGQALDPSMISSTSQQVVVSQGIGGVLSWAFCTILIASEILTGDEQNRAKEIVRYFTGDREATGRRTAEWWACVRTVRV